jgi:spermidine/putrescine ABC transporter ATP-binding subunit
VLAVGTPPAGAGRPLSTEALRLVRLGKRFGPVVALEETTLQVEPGEFLTILGPSGSGKTTLLNLVAGFEAPTTGEVWLGDRSLTAEPPNRRNVGMVFQHYALFPHMTVFANVAFPLRLRKLPPREVRARVEEMLELVQLAGLGDRHPRELSGGQQQRVALARALVFRPPLLLMDEPFGALDAHLRSRMQAELRQVHRRLGVTVLFVTHDQEEAMAMADRIAVMARGRLQQLGTARELYERPANAFVAGFVGESNLLRGTLSRAVDGALRLITAGGAELALPPGAPAAAGAATVLVRPEALRITLDGPGGRTGLPGTVEEALYLGPLRKYTVRINPAEALTVRQPGEPGARELAAGDRVRVEWDPRDLRLL